MEDKFKGCMVGGLVGDCLGGPFEDQMFVAPRELKKFFDNLVNSTSEGQYNYTDDTAMAWNMLDSLHEKQKYDPKDMSTKFSETYFKESFRYYGGHVVHVFADWRRGGLVDVYQPAQMQFGGTGSYGNGGAMRVAPIALYCYKHTQQMIELASSTTRLTHAHHHGIVGALLQCWAVRLALDEDPTVPLDVDKFITRLQEKIRLLETDFGSDSVDLYNEQLTKLKDFVQRDRVIVGVVVEEFGNSVVAPESVATALYCFLRATREVDFIHVENKFERTIQLAIAMGNDTDTIACMAGSIAGAYYGLQEIPPYLQKCCEKLADALNYGERLFSRVK